MDAAKAALRAAAADGGAVAGPHATDSPADLTDSPGGGAAAAAEPERRATVRDRKAALKRAEAERVAADAEVEAAAEEVRLSPPKRCAASPRRLCVPRFTARHAVSIGAAAALRLLACAHEVFNPKTRTPQVALRRLGEEAAIKAHGGHCHEAGW